MGKHAHTRKDKHKRKKNKGDKTAKKAASKASVSNAPSAEPQDVLEAAVDRETESKVKPSTLPREEWMTQPKEGWLAVNHPTQATKEDNPEAASLTTHAPGLYVPGKGEGQTSSEKGGVGDGGAGWRLRALKRMQERSREEGRSLQQMAAERGMDLDALEREAANRHRRNDRRYRSEWSNRPKMHRPPLTKSIFWRKKETKSDQKDDAVTLNRFPNDGSFMETFAKLTELKREKSEAVQLDARESHAMTSTMNNTSVAEQLRRQLASSSSIKHVPQSTKAQTSASVTSTGNRRDVSELGRKRREIEDDVDISELYKRTKIGNDRDIDDIMADNIVRRRHFDRRDLAADNEYDYNVGTDLFTSKHKKNRRNACIHERTNKQRDHGHRMETMQQKCVYCFDGHGMPKHLIISIATVSYLRLPESAPLVPGHCWIVPAEHLPTTRETDDHVWTEIRNFKKALIQMHHSLEMDVIFLESAVRLRDQRRHAYVECIPVEHDVFQKAPVYFKKAIDDATEDWSQHHSKRCINTSKKGLRGSIPEHFPYFHVEFNLHSGFVHVIDDEDGFDVHLGRKVLMGLMHLPPEDMYKRTQRNSIEEQKQSVEKFRRQWHPYDWTRQL